MTTLLLSLALRLAAPAPSAPLDFTITPQDKTSLRVTLSGPAADLPAGPFKGVIALNGSASDRPRNVRAPSEANVNVV